MWSACVGVCQLLNWYIKFNEYPSNGSRAIQCGRTDGQDEAHSRVSQFC